MVRNDSEASKGIPEVRFGRERDRARADGGAGKSSHILPSLSEGSGIAYRRANDARRFDSPYERRMVFQGTRRGKIRAIAIAAVIENQVVSQNSFAYHPVGTIHGYEEDEEDRSYQFYDKRCVHDYRNLSMGLGISEVKRRLEEDEKVFNVVKPEDLMENPLIPGRGSGCSASGLPPGDVSGKPTANSFTYSQKKKMKGKEQAQEESPNLKSERLDPAFAEN